MNAAKGHLENLDYTLPFPLPLLAFLEHHQLRCDPEGYAQVTSNRMEITLENKIIRG